MTNKQLKNLKDTLWTTADQLRANSDIVNIGLHFFLKNIRLYATACNES